MPFKPLFRRIFCTSAKHCTLVAFLLVKRSFYKNTIRHNVTKWDKNVSFSALIVSFEVWIFDVHIKASQKCVSHIRWIKNERRKPSSTAIDTHKQILNSFHRCRCRHHCHRQNIIQRFFSHFVWKFLSLKFLALSSPIDIILKDSLHLFLRAKKIRFFIHWFRRFRLFGISMFMLSVTRTVWFVWIESAQKYVACWWYSQECSINAMALLPFSFESFMFLCDFVKSQCNTSFGMKQPNAWKGRCFSRTFDSKPHTAYQVEKHIDRIKCEKGSGLNK